MKNLKSGKRVVPLVFLIAIVLLVALAVRPYLAPHGATLRRFSGEGITFSYPGSWHAYQFGWASTRTIPLAYVSNQRLHPPCTGMPGVLDCELPISTLQPDSALLVWTDEGLPLRFGPALGTLLRINGRRARVRQLAATPDSCPRNSRLMVDAILERPRVPDNWYELSACISGPHVREEMRQVMTILRSFRASA